MVLGSGASSRYRTGAGGRDGKHGRDGHSRRETRHRGLHGEGSVGQSGASGMAGLVQSTRPRQRRALWAWKEFPRLSYWWWEVIGGFEASSRMSLAFFKDQAGLEGGRSG